MIAYLSATYATFKNNASCICDMQHLQGTRSFVEVIKLLEVELKLLHYRSVILLEVTLLKASVCRSTNT